MTTLRDRLLAFWLLPHAPAEIGAAWITFWAGGVGLLWPGATFTSSATYTQIAVYASEPAWGLAFLLASILQAGGVAASTLPARLIGAYVSGFLWGIWAILAWLTNPTSAGTFTWSGLAFLQAYLIFRAAGRYAATFQTVPHAPPHA